MVEWIDEVTQARDALGFDPRADEGSGGAANHPQPQGDGYRAKRPLALRPSCGARIRLSDVTCEDVLQIPPAQPIGVAFHVVLERLRIGGRWWREAFCSDAVHRLAGPVRHILVRPVPGPQRASGQIRGIIFEREGRAVRLIGAERGAIHRLGWDVFGVEEAQEPQRTHPAIGRQRIQASAQRCGPQRLTAPVRFGPIQTNQDGAQFAAKAGHASRGQPEGRGWRGAQPAQAGPCHRHRRAGGSER